MTRRFVVLGDPVAHSRSPSIHTAAYRALGLDAEYTARAVDEVGMAAAVGEIRDGHLAGANVTMPHKRLAATLADRLDPVAARLGVVNTLTHDAGSVVGHATDGAGILHAWTVGSLPAGGPVLVLGAGGAARAAIDVLSGRHEVWVSARRPGAAEEAAGAGAVGTVVWGKPLEGAVVVNATPIGMAGDRLPAGLVEDATAYFEMVYAPERTPAVVVAEERGMPVARGIDMLIGQAAASFAIWFGTEPPLPEMLAGAKRSSTA